MRAQTPLPLRPDVVSGAGEHGLANLPRHRRMRYGLSRNAAGFRKRSMKLRALIALAAVLPLVSVGVVLVPMRANERWETMTRWAEKTEAEWNARDFEREPLFGEKQPGRAFDRYQKATALAGLRDDAARALLRDLRLHAGRVGKEGRAAFDEAWSEPLAHMREGAHAADARPSISWRHGIAARSFDLLRGRDVVNAAVVRSRALCAEGKRAEAAELGIDAATFATDLLQSPMVIDQMIASALLTIVCTELFDEPTVAAMDSATRVRVETALGALESRCPTGFRGTGEALLLAHSLLRSVVGAAPELEEEEGMGTTAGWRQGWSKKWAMADSVLLLADVSAQLRAGESLPWARRQELVEAQRERLRKDPTATTQAWDEMIGGAERTLRIALAHLRLLRASLRLAEGSEAEQIVDPFGDGPFGTARDGDAVRISSAGGSKLHPLARSVAVR